MCWLNKLATPLFCQGDCSSVTVPGLLRLALAVAVSARGSHEGLTKEKP